MGYCLGQVWQKTVSFSLIDTIYSTEIESTVTIHYAYLNLHFLKLCLCMGFTKTK